MTRKEIVESRGRNRFIIYQPGNTTRYDVMFAPVPEDSGAVAFCWFNPTSGAGRLLRLRLTDEYGPLNYRYFMTKLDCCGADAAALLVLIHETLNRTVVLPPSYNELGLYVGGDVEVELQREEAFKFSLKIEDTVVCNPDGSAKVRDEA